MPNATWPTPAGSGWGSGLSGLANVAQQFLRWYVSGSQWGTYRRAFADAGGSDYSGPVNTVPPSRQRVTDPQTGTHSTAYDATINAATDSASSDLGTGYNPPYAQPFAVRAIIKRGNSDVVWNQYGLQLDENQTYGVFLHTDLTPSRFDVLIMPDTNRYVVGQQIAPIMVYDRCIGWVAQLERRDPSDPIYRL